jgi:hypothetical protein
VQKTIVRTARKAHICEGCRSTIKPGERYLEWVASPYHSELNNAHWWRLAECGQCAERYGRKVA